MIPPRLSLLVGSDALGWADLGDSAVIGDRTKGMPGGDGSLSFTLPPDVAAKARNQLQHKARVKLTANGAPDFGGRICSDPFGDVRSAVKDAVTVECSGLWAWADRYGAFAWVWHDTDTSQWSATAQAFDTGAAELIPAEGVEADKFDADTEGRLFIRADSTAAFSPYSSFRLNYWLLGGLGMGCEIVRLAVTYKCNMPNYASLLHKVADENVITSANPTNDPDDRLRANDFKNTFNDHTSSVEYHTAPGMAITTPDATDDASLISLCQVLNTMMMAHATTNQHGGRPDIDLASALAVAALPATPTKAQCRTWLSDAVLKAAWEAHIAITELGDGAPGPWQLWFYSNNNPWDQAYWDLNWPGEVTSRTSWYTTGFNIGPAYPNQCLSMSLWRGSNTAGAVSEVVSDPWVWVSAVWVVCRLGLTGDASAASLSDALCDMATRAGLATVTRGETIYALETMSQLAVPSMTSIRGGLLEIAGLYSGEIEYWFDLDEAGNDRFNHYSKPATADPTRNSVWSYGDAAGESTAGLDHDPELCPDWIRMMYLSDGVAEIPNGTPRAVWYPALPSTVDPDSARVITEFADRPFTDVHASALARRVHARIAASEWSGSVPVPFTMTDVAGRERGGWQVRQGDRISVPSRDGADDLYVTEVSWNWTSLTGSATVGYPWEVTGMLGTEAAVPAPFVRPSMIEG